MSLLYVFSCFLIVLLVIALIISLNKSTIIVFFPFFFGIVLAIISTLYLETGVYIFEQNRFSYATGATIRLLFYVVIMLGAFNIINLIFGRYLNSLEIILKEDSQPNLATKSGSLFCIFFSALILSILYANVLISGNVPLFSEGYISRFDYLQTTYLWKFISPLGSTSSTVPILLGFAIFKTSDFKIRSLINTLFFLYTLYIVLIGHKFGGIVYGGYYFLLPSLLRYVVRNGLIYSRKLIAWTMMLTAVSFSIVYYHYSKYELVYQFGGPFKFILYRIFALQAHTWWGIDNYIFIEGGKPTFSFDSIFNGMHAIMRLVGPPNIEIAIERGVNFTFGFFPSLLLSLGPVTSIVILVSVPFLCFLTIMAIFLGLRHNNVLLYYVSVNIMIWLSNYISLGSANVLVEPKVLLFYYATFILTLLHFLVNRRNKMRYKNIYLNT